MIESAIFPIPECVVFPGMVYPLHIFEPRYRSMVKYCIREKLMLAIAHTKKRVSESKNKQTREQMLRSNQATYKPFEVFSAGKCELIDVMPDGRMQVQVHIQKRLRLLKKTQVLPFMIGECEEIFDKPMSDHEAQSAKVTQQKVLARLLTVTHDIPKIKELIMNEKWQNLTPEEMSFEVFRVLEVEAEVQQRLLESTSASERLGALLNIMNMHP